MNHNSDTPDSDLPQDEQISQAYQALDKQTSPSALDESILAAARREVRSRPQNISFSQRWAVPVSVAAVIVLSVSLLTLYGDRMLIESEPTPTSAVRSTPAPAARIMEQEKSAVSVEEKRDAFKQRGFAAPVESDMPQADEQQDKDSPVGGAQLLESTPALKKEKAVAPTAARMSDAVTSAETQLDAIRQLVKDGKHEEALTALKTFQQQYPDYSLDADLKSLLD